jgi:hypothetical protein
MASRAAGGLAAAVTEIMERSDPAQRGGEVVEQNDMTGGSEEAEVSQCYWTRHG